MISHSLCCRVKLVRRQGKPNSDQTEDAGSPAERTECHIPAHCWVPSQAAVKQVNAATPVWRHNYWIYEYVRLFVVMLSYLTTCSAAAQVVAG